MATKTFLPTTEISEIKHKLEKVNENFTVYMYDNGFMFEIAGRNRAGDYKTVKILCQNIDQLVSLVQQAADMEKDD
jgi:hypothetical protein